MTRFLWRDKAYVPLQFRDMLSTEPKAAYKLSLADSKRDCITKEELCGFRWQWRFKESAGDHFLAEDPWWNGRQPRERTYNEDGSMGGHIYRWVPTRACEGWKRRKRGEIAEERGYEIGSSELTSLTYPLCSYSPDARWRFVPTAAGLSSPPGKFVRVANTPASILSRHSNWGWLMQSCWSLATAFPLPAKGTDMELEDENLAITTKTQKLVPRADSTRCPAHWPRFGYRYEVLLYNSGISYPDHVVLDRAGFERVCRRSGWNLGLALDGESDDEEGGEEEEEGDEEDGEEEDVEVFWETTDDDATDPTADSDTASDGEEEDSTSVRLLLRDARRSRAAALEDAVENKGTSSTAAPEDETEDSEEDPDYV